MKILSERPERHVERLKIRINPTTQSFAWDMLTPTRTYECDHGRIVKLEPHEMGVVDMEFRDTQELDELIRALTKFRNQVRSALGEWI